jgi:nucleotide-binding universal stress UspA family protein
MSLVHVSTYSATYLSRDAKSARAEARDMLERERAQARMVAEVSDIESPSVGRGLHQLAEQSAADLLVVGSCSRGMLGRVLSGDDTRAALNGASCAVAVAPHGYAESTASIKTVGVGYNGTPEASATVRALTVVSPLPGGLGYWEAFDPDWSMAIDAVGRTANERLRLLDGVDGSVAVGVPSEALAAFGAEVGLLVVGSRSYGPIRRMMLGSTSLHLAHGTLCPLLVLPRPVAVGHVQDER